MSIAMAIANVSFDTCILDSDIDKNATSKLELALDQVKDMILSGHIMDHPNLFKGFDHNHAAPECRTRTWSRAAIGIYRNKEFIDGHIHIGRLVLPPDSSAVKLLH